MDTTTNQILVSEGYWLGDFQVKLLDSITKYMEKKGINQTQLAKELGCSKSYISQILNGNFDHRISQYIKLLIAVGKIPVIELVDKGNDIDDNTLLSCTVIDDFDNLKRRKTKNATTMRTYH